MFFAETLKKKLDDSMKGILDKKKDCLFPYKFSKNNKTTLLSELNSNNPEYTHKQLKEMSKKDYLKQFCKKNLLKKWDRKCKVNYAFTTIKLGQILTKKAIENKKYIKNFVDKDIFELKTPDWNNSTKPDDKTDIKSHIKNLKNQADNCVKKLEKRKLNNIYKDNFIIHCDLNSQWNVSSKLEQKEKDDLDKNLFLKSMHNTQKYWMKYHLNKENNNFNNGSVLLNQKYLIIPSTNEKNILLEERKNNSNSVIISNYISKEKQKNYWKDKELSEKIRLIDAWNEPSFYNELNKLYKPDELKNEMIRKFIYNKSKIEAEQRKIKEEKYNSERIKKEKSEKLNKTVSPLNFSKYPLLLGQKKIFLNKKNFNDKNNEINIINNEDNKTFIQACQKIILEERNKNKNKKNNKKRCLSCKNIKKGFINKIIKYKHPGIYREFIYNISNNNQNEGPYNDNEDFKNNINNEEKFMAWSCCNNVDKNSKGCTKYYEKVYLS